MAGSLFFEHCGRVLQTLCQLDLEYITVRPGHAESKIITAYAGLKGMGELQPGSYTLRRPLALHRGHHVKRRGAFDFTFTVGS